MKTFAMGILLMCSLPSQATAQETESTESTEAHSTWYQAPEHHCFLHKLTRKLALAQTKFQLDVQAIRLDLQSDRLIREAHDLEMDATILEAERAACPSCQARMHTTDRSNALAKKIAKHQRKMSDHNARMADYALAVDAYYWELSLLENPNAPRQPSGNPFGDVHFQFPRFIQPIPTNPEPIEAEPELAPTPDPIGDAPGTLPNHT